MKDKIFEEIKKTLPGIKKNVLLKNYTTFKIGGPARYFYIAKTKEDLIRAVVAAKKLKLPIFILGGGSNILVADKGFKGVVIKTQNSKLKVQNHNSKLKTIYVEAGAKLADLISFCVKNNLTGLEWASGIPGTVGGAIFGHAQAFGIKMSDSIKRVETLDIKTLKIKNLDKRQCRFSLKNSIFKKNKNLVIVSAVLKLKKGNKKQIQEKKIEYLNYRKANHPIFLPSAGSVFVNPEIHPVKYRKAVISASPKLFDRVKTRVIRAGSLIEKCGLKGKKIGKAQFSPQHANFIVNLGGAEAKDVLALIKLAKQKVKKTFGINLETEVQIWK